jgi:hypothetical protein
VFFLFGSFDNPINCLSSVVQLWRQNCGHFHLTFVYPTTNYWFGFLQIFTRFRGVLNRSTSFGKELEFMNSVLSQIFNNLNLTAQSLNWYCSSLHKSFFTTRLLVEESHELIKVFTWLNYWYLVIYFGWWCFCGLSGGVKRVKRLLVLNQFLYHSKISLVGFGKSTILSSSFGWLWRYE